MNREILIEKNMLRRLLAVFKYDGKEAGGVVFFCDRKVSSFYLDRGGASTVSEYRPDPEGVGKAVIGALNSGSDDFAFIHSHPDNRPLSNADIEYVRSFIRLNDLGSMRLIIVYSDRLSCYLIDEESCTSCPLKIC